MIERLDAASFVSRLETADFWILMLEPISGDLVMNAWFEQEAHTYIGPDPMEMGFDMTRIFWDSLLNATKDPEIANKELISISVREAQRHRKV